MAVIILILLVTVAKHSEVIVSEGYDMSCRVTREHYLNTEEFIDAVAQNLETKLQAPTLV